ncbi:MAG: ribosome silencing factor [Gammaproteobacteria bacterium CG11_big_fil_rev_8_21_14_0_20_46_22]|nr:MAG: ribosome silencing factor [Gammaproteobacteria bacterium CG12_big_fil_rev_8_21_14_0_65_46_12]PIR10837.1 MAG: ribosome silencing factor [Gammaproteobacteria bacterium CG11_big_fil_rev_8_21_14_0_20_46_22]
MLTPEKLCDIATLALEDVKAKDIKVLNVQGLTSIADYMIICSATSSRQLQALANNVAKEAKAQGARPFNRNFTDQNEWALVDLGDVIVHVMLPETREYYALEKLWENVKGDEDHTD